MNQYCETYIKISRNALEHNAQYFKTKSNKKLIAVIKSNAYGHGLIEVGKILEEEADVFAVASLDSAIKLREEGIKKPILVLNPLNSKHASAASKHNIMITINNLHELKTIASSIKENISVQIKVDTGMNRMGCKTEADVKEILSYCEGLDNIKIVGIYTHFHSADNPVYSQNQQTRFKEILNSIDYHFEYIHLCSTSATLNNWDIPKSTHVRIGLGLYGICGDQETKPVLSLYSKIMIKKEVYPGETVGYSANYKPVEKSWIGVLPCGYSDGIIRSNTGRKVYIDGNYCEIIGSICMNSLMIKLPHEDIDTEVELIGPHVSAIDIAKHLNTISYEVVTVLPPHIKRIII